MSLKFYRCVIIKNFWMNFAMYTNIDYMLIILQYASITQYITQCYFFDPRPSTNQSTSLKSGSLFLVIVSVRPYKTKQTDQRVKSLFKLVLWLVIGR